MPENKEYSISAFLKSVKQPVARKEILYLRENEPEKLEKLSTGWEKPQYLFRQRGGGYFRPAGLCRRRAPWYGISGRRENIRLRDLS